MATNTVITTNEHELSIIALTQHQLGHAWAWLRSAHTLYEKTHPDMLPGPSGMLNLTHIMYKQLTLHIMHVRGIMFESRPYRIKLKGVKKTGFRLVFIGGIRDVGLIAQINHVLSIVENDAQMMDLKFTGDNCCIAFDVYGKNRVMGLLEAVKQHTHELCVLCEVLTPTQGLVHSVFNALYIVLLHTPYAYQVHPSPSPVLPHSHAISWVAMGENLVSPFTSMETGLGEASEFCVYHLIDVDDPLAPFPITYQTMSSAAHALEQMKKEMEGKKVDLVTQWQWAIKCGEKVIELQDVVMVLRSKNSGPYKLMFDVIFLNEENFQEVKNSGVPKKDILVKVYGVKPEMMLTCLFFPQVHAFKFTISRMQPNGSFGETDMHGLICNIDLKRSD
ncbi:uncharacterized protein LAESUDRAFT_757752 [Laetiporus sulphureus 93-53]|uniref:Uncharacterized protein n=1 Tax=Laetiporus sulphureus 93-53 TaxID=1314785 RepID=A0A165F771_9APHY|nr:uncharacterized protein LAESUDRAFT_757752 [Laetiporus sulphureus 93-53]KZT08520.1 hypothetical protein LAESUDRAFT_757752 [Laetiporus sulphureus 93-53]